MDKSSAVYAKLVGGAKSLASKAKNVASDAKAGYQSAGKKGRPRKSTAAKAGRKTKETINKGVDYAKKNPGKASIAGGAAVGAVALNRKSEKKAEHIFSKWIKPEK